MPALKNLMNNTFTLFLLGFNLGNYWVFIRAVERLIFLIALIARLIILIAR